jgi:hypothetical protein
MVKIPFGCVINARRLPSLAVGLAGVFGFGRFAGRLSRRTDRVYFYSALLMHRFFPVLNPPR